MSSEEYQELIEDYVDRITSFLKEEGGINPHIAFFAEKKEPDEDGRTTAIVHLDIPNFDKVEFDQETFLSDVLPQIFSQIKHDFKVKAIAFTAEAFVRVAPKEFDHEKEDFRKIPIDKEILFISLETEDKTELIIFDIHKDGQVINEDGKLIDKIELVRETVASVGEPSMGAYNNLWQKYM